MSSRATHFLEIPFSAIVPGTGDIGLPGRFPLSPDSIASGKRIPESLSPDSIDPTSIVAALSACRYLIHRFIPVTPKTDLFVRTSAASDNMAGRQAFHPIAEYALS